MPSMTLSVLCCCLLPLAFASKYTQVSEMDRAHLVVLHEPSDEVFTASLHPAGSLFEKPTTQGMAVQASRNLQASLRARGIEVVTVESALLKLKLQKLRTMAKDALQYNFTGPADALTSKRKKLLSDNYKKTVLEGMDAKDLVRVILGRPKVTLSATDQNTPLAVDNVAFSPLGNLVFTRDQQIVTAKGVVMGRMNSPQRFPETTVMRAVFESIGAPVVGTIPEPHFLEGGDYVPADEAVFLGVGLRTTMGAAKYLLDNDLFGVKRVVVVEDRDDKNQDRMHLDTVFAIADRKVAVLLDNVGTAGTYPRIANEYVLGKDGRYKLEFQGEFESYLKDRLGYHVIHATNAQQLGYAINFLQLGGATGDILSVSKETASILAKRPRHIRTESAYVEFEGIKRMYGAAHCSTQVFRMPNPARKQEDLGAKNKNNGLGNCCTQCDPAKSKPCGNVCIKKGLKCTKKPGCACVKSKKFEL